MHVYRNEIKDFAGLLSVSQRRLHVEFRQLVPTIPDRSTIHTEFIRAFVQADNLKETQFPSRKNFVDSFK